MISQQVIFHISGPSEISHVNSSAYIEPARQTGLVTKGKKGISQGRKY